MKQFLDNLGLIALLFALVISIPHTAEGAEANSKKGAEALEELRKNGTYDSLANALAAVRGKDDNADLGAHQTLSNNAFVGATKDRFGSAVAMSGNFAIVGAPRCTAGPPANTGAGAAYVFFFSGSSWTLVATLGANDGTPGDCFGYSVGISGDYAIVGAYGADEPSTTNNQGHAYIFHRLTGNWSQVALLKASDKYQNDNFGWSVGISGNRAVIGAPFAEPPISSSTANDQGQAYIFERTGSAWNEVKILRANESPATVNNSDQFGMSVAIDGVQVVVGTPVRDETGKVNTGAAYVFEQNFPTPANWGQSAKLTDPAGVAQDYFGYSVAISLGTIAVGAPMQDFAGDRRGRVHIFEKVGTTWSIKEKIRGLCCSMGDFFGNSVALEGDTLVVGTKEDDIGWGTGQVNQGTAFLYKRTGSVWNFQRRFLDNSPAANDNFGASVAVSAGRIFVGTPSDDLSGGQDQGTVFAFFSGPPSNITLLASGTSVANDRYGSSVAISGDRAVVGAPFDKNSGGVQTGSVYIFARNGTSWALEKQLNGPANSWFGYSVAISGETVVVGDPLIKIGSNPEQGQVYVFDRINGAWYQHATLSSPTAAAADQFGWSVSISCNSLVVGAPGVAGNKGAAYLYSRNVTAWPIEATLAASTVTAGDRYGQDVSISGDAVVVGAPMDDIGSNTDQGSAFFFTRSGGMWDPTLQQYGLGNWSPAVQINPTGGAIRDNFGYSVAISDHLIAIGAPYKDVGSKNAQGVAYVYRWNGGNSLTQFPPIYRNGTPSAGDRFGISIAISGEFLIVGSVAEDGLPNPGAGTVFAVSSTGAASFQSSIQQVTATSGGRFGVDVAIDGRFAMAGAQPIDGSGIAVGVGQVTVFSGTYLGVTQQITN